MIRVKNSEGFIREMTVLEYSLYKQWSSTNMLLNNVYELSERTAVIEEWREAFLDNEKTGERLVNEFDWVSKHMFRTEWTSIVEDEAAWVESSGWTKTEEMNARVVDMLLKFYKGEQTPNDEMNAMTRIRNAVLDVRPNDGVTVKELIEGVRRGTDVKWVQAAKEFFRQQRSNPNEFIQTWLKTYKNG